MKRISIVITVVMAIAVIVSAFIASTLYIKLRHEKSLMVKGYSETPVISDIGDFSVNLEVKDVKLSDAYKKLKSQTDRLIKFIKVRAPEDSSIALDTPSINKIHKKSPKGVRINEIDYYTLTNSIKVTSTDVQWLKKLNLRLVDFLSDGYVITIYRPDFRIQNLNEIKLKLLEQATANGYKRAVTMAKHSSGKVGSLCSARQGVFQITSPNSTETSSWGCYDTSTIKKTVKAVVTLEYLIE